MSDLSLAGTLDWAEQLNAETLLRDWRAEPGIREIINQAVRPDAERPLDRLQAKDKPERRPERSDAAPASPIQPQAESETDREGYVTRLEAELAVAKAALRSERDQFTQLRAEVDEFKVLKLLWEAEKARAEQLRVDRDLWAERAKTLALPLFQDIAPLEAEPHSAHAPSGPADTEKGRNGPVQAKRDDSPNAAPQPKRDASPNPSNQQKH